MIYVQKKIETLSHKLNVCSIRLNYKWKKCFKVEENTFWVFICYHMLSELGEFNNFSYGTQPLRETGRQDVQILSERAVIA